MTSQVVEASIIIASNNPFRDYSTPTSKIRLLSLLIICCHFGYLKRSNKIRNVNKKPEDSIMPLFIWFEENI